MWPLFKLFTVIGYAVFVTNASNDKRAQTVYLAGDSTMAKQSTNIQGSSLSHP